MKKAQYLPKLRSRHRGGTQMTSGLVWSEKDAFSLIWNNVVPAQGPISIEKCLPGRGNLYRERASPARIPIHARIYNDRVESPGTHKIVSGRPGVIQGQVIVNAPSNMINHRFFSSLYLGQEAELGQQAAI